MDPSERVKLISDISNELADEEWSLIDLVLRQFGLPWTDNWGTGSKDSYVIAMIEEADDQILLNLAAHIGL